MPNHADLVFEERRDEIRLRRGHEAWKAVALYGIPFATALLSIAVIFLADKAPSEYRLYLYWMVLLNGVIAVVGCSLAGSLQRDDLWSRLRGMFDGGDFGLAWHVISLFLIGGLIIAMMRIVYWWTG